MISPANRTDLNWTSSSSDGPSATTPAPLDSFDTSLSNAAATDSFQAVFAQIASSSPVLSGAPGTMSNYSWPDMPYRTTTGGSGRSATSGSPSENSAKTSAGGLSAESQRIAQKSAARAVPSKLGKLSTTSAAMPSGKGTVPMGAAAEDAAAVSTLNPGAAAPADDTSRSPAAKSNSSGNSASPNSPSNALPAAALNALGGLKSLTGSAFALHITPGDSQANGGHGNANGGSANQGNTDQSDSNSAVSTAVVSGDLPTSASATAHVPSGVEGLASANLTGSTLVSWSAGGPVTASSNPPDHQPALSTLMEVAEAGNDDPSAAPQTVKTVQVQLTSEGNERVDLRLVQHAGGLSVSVRASDSALTKGLQDNLPELSARLAADKYQTHTLIPAAAEPAGASSSFHSSEEPSSGQSQQHGGSGTGGRSFSQGGDGRQSQSQTGDQSGGQQAQDQASAAWWRQLAALGKSSSSATHSVFGSQPITAANPQTNS